jgi:putative membrane protein insertion efficiency factor
MTSLRRLLWSVGAPARLVLIGAIAVYRLTLSGWLGGQCRFSPTCSRYAEEAVRSHGAIRGSFLAVGRVLRCNPFGRGGLDPVPPARWLDDPVHNVYDDAIRRGSSPLSERHHAG